MDGRRDRKIRIDETKTHVGARRQTNEDTKKEEIKQLKKVMQLKGRLDKAIQKIKKMKD